MRLKKTLLAGLTAALLIPGFANAGFDFKFDWAATGEGFNGVSPSATLREMKFTAESAIVFNGVPFGTGVTFTDYIVLRVDQLFDSSSNVVGPYGPSDQMQITMLAKLTGIQIDALNYVVNGVSSFNVYYDGPTGGFTNANFAQASLASFTDSALVETATSVNGTGTNSPLAPDGVLDMTVALLDGILNGDFEVDVNGGSLGNHLFGITNSNNHLCGGGAQTCASSATNILAKFGEGPNLNAIHTKSDGSIEKIPEPATMALLGLGLLGMGATLRRRKV